MKVLLTDASYLQTLAIVRYLAKENIDVFVIGSNELLDISRYSKYCQGYFRGPSPENERVYINFILKVLVKKKINLLIPVGYIATAIASKYKDKINQIAKVEVANYDKVKIALNKKSTYELAERLGVPYPKTLYPKSLEEVEKIAKKIDYPVVVKWLFETGDSIVVIVQNEEELIKKYYTICQKYNPPTTSLPMIQEFISASHNVVYCVSSLYQNGKCKRIFIQKQTRNVPVKGGTCAYAESCYIPEIKTYSQKLLDGLIWHGVAHLEFKLDKQDNLFKLMEINPKFWASTDMALRAGVNFPYLLCQMARGKELKYSEEYDRGLKFHFPFSRELQHIKEKPVSVFRVTLDIFNPKVKSNIWLSDLKPNIVELIISLGKLFLPNKIRNFFLKRIKKNDKNTNSK